MKNKQSNSYPQINKKKKDRLAFLFPNNENVGQNERKIEKKSHFLLLNIDIKKFYIRWGINQNLSISTLANKHRF